MLIPMSQLLPTDIIVRHAFPFEAGRIQELYGLLVSNPSVQVRPESIASLSTDKAALFVCVANSIIVATALVCLCADVMFVQQPFAVVENVVVDPAWRGQGVGTKLFSHLEAFCRARECSKIMLLSASAREDAHRFFARAGYDGQAKQGFVKYRRHFSETT